MICHRKGNLEHCAYNTRIAASRYPIIRHRRGRMSDEEYEYDYGSDYGDMDEEGGPENEIAIEIENSFYEAVRGVFSYLPFQ